VRLVQPAVTQLEKFDGERMRELARQLASLARDDDPQLIVAPETALPHDWRALPSDVTNDLLAAAPRGGVFLLGMFATDPDVGLLNVSNALRADAPAATPQRYVKQRLVPVAEQPTAGLRWLSDALALRYPARATDGEPPVVFDVNGVGVRTTLCLDLAFGADLADTAGATQLLVNQSNFAALPGKRVRAQFTRLARVRALEQAKPLLLVSNDGPSAVIDWRGEIVASLPDGRDAALAASVTPRSGATPYATFGEMLWMALLAAAALVLVAMRTRGK
jgi:apolipoprotein N-acyltransferase